MGEFTKEDCAIEKLRWMVNNFDFEYDSILYDLPSIQSLIEYRELWDVYDTEFLAGIVEIIQDGADAKPYNDFVAKYSLPWDELPYKEEEEEIC